MFLHSSKHHFNVTTLVAEKNIDIIFAVLLRDGIFDCFRNMKASKLHEYPQQTTKQCQRVHAKKQKICHLREAMH